MNRALLLLPMAALASGCYVAPPCDPVANVYWTFTVPGLNGLMSCAEAGVNSVDVFVDGALVDTVPCQGPAADGIQLVGFGPGTRLLQLDVYDGNTRRYQFDGNIAFDGCTSGYDVVASGVAGDMDLTYLFLPAQSCLPNSYAWFQLRDSAGGNFDVAPISTLNACGPQVIGPVALPAGVYTLSKLEVGVISGNSWTPDYNNCSPQTFLHAGPGSLSTTLVPATASCWP